MLTEAQLRAVMAAAIPNIEIGAIPTDGRLRDFGVDSLDVYTVVSELQKLTGIDASDEEVERLTDIKSFVLLFCKP